MLGAGEQLRKVATTVEQLLDRSAKAVREWDGVSHTRVWVLTLYQCSPSSPRMETLYPCVHPLWSLSNDGSARTLIHQRRVPLVLIDIA